MPGQDTQIEKICNIRFLINGRNVNYTHAKVLSLKNNLIVFVDRKTNQRITYNTRFLISSVEVFENGF